MLVAAAMLVATINVICYQSKKINYLNVEYAREKFNYETVSEMLNGEQSSNKVLQLRIEEIINSKDNLIIGLMEELKKEKIKLSKVQTAAIIQTQLVDSLTKQIQFTTDRSNVELIGDSIHIIHYCDFEEEFVYNDETKIKVSVIGDSSTCIPDITNEIDFAVWLERRYVNDYKTWFGRLFHWDWKKYDDLNYLLKMSNEAIRTKKVRVINVKQ
jgi:hypothetical protein